MICLKTQYVFLLACVLLAIEARAQLWTPILSESRAIDWSASGVGSIPSRPDRCASLTSSATVAEINAALASCAQGETVYLAPGTYTIAGMIEVPSHVTLRGAGANQTILNAVGSAGGFVVGLGSGGVPFQPVAITGGANAGSTRITLDNASNLRAGEYLAIAEENDPGFVSSAGTEANCNWCDGGWTSTGRLARGQIVAVIGVRGSTVTIAPGLYGGYTHEPVAVPFAMAAIEAGVEDLQIRANNTGYAANFGMSRCAFCWLKGVESNYTDGDHVSIFWGFRDEVRDSYFSNAFLHRPGAHDSDMQIASKTSASLIENNIMERGHDSVMLEWGAAGNVVAYNYMMGEFDSGSTNVVIGGVNFHGAHPQFNLLEGNILTQIYADSTWGSSSHTTAFRNWVVGTNRICSPMSGRGAVECSGARGHYGFQAARAMQFSHLATHNSFVANIVGSAQMQSLRAYGKPVAQLDIVEYPAERRYDTSAMGWSFGYGDLSDAGSGSPCRVAASPCHLAGTASTNFFRGNYSNITGAITWSPSGPESLPSSFYIAKKPAWWGALPFPSIGPDVSGGTGPGGHTYRNPAQSCYLNTMGGSDGGAGGPLNFNASVCYTSSELRDLPAKKGATH